MWAWKAASRDFEKKGLDVVNVRLFSRSLHVLLPCRDPNWGRWGEGERDNFQIEGCNEQVEVKCECICLQYRASEVGMVIAENLRQSQTKTQQI